MVDRIISFALKRPKTVFFITALAVFVSFLQFFSVKVDTDPENMLSEKEFARVFHHKTKKDFALSDFIVVGVINESSPAGVFNVKTLGNLYELTKKIGEIDGVVKRDIVSPSTKEDVEQAGPGAIRFGWLMPEPPENEREALHIRLRALGNPLYNGTMVSEDGKAVCLYVPIERKDISYKAASQIKKEIARLDTGNDKFYITGLPVAEDTFGHEMFIQMAISAPLAGLVILLLLYLFFRQMLLIIAPMILAVVTVIITMGLLTGLGYPVHIMSSMIPIFLMPIAVLDSVHILSEFFDEYHLYHDRAKTITHVLKTLFVPMLYTSLTTFAGFISLSFSDIPPVQVFGVFVGLGVAIAWILTIVFIPAYISILPAKAVDAISTVEAPKTAKHSAMAGFIDVCGRFSVRNAKLITAFAVLIAVFSVYGIKKIVVNDNPVRWFSQDHEIRISDRVLNEHFSGTYMAYFVMESEDGKDIFSEPAMLEYLSALQEYLKSTGYVGKTTSLSDAVKKIYFELMGGSDNKYYAIPASKAAVSQCLIQFESSRKPDDLWHMVTPDYTGLNLWLQLKSGDNRDTERVIASVRQYLKNNPPPFKIKGNWAGLTYVNVVWQNNMVVGMLRNFLGSFIIVYFMMVFLLASPVRALISMVPLTLTILFIYGLLGHTGKYYDMPVAVLSALTLGLSIDFAIHFIQRARDIAGEDGKWEDVAPKMFGSPSMAITRNAVVVAIGFTPLLFAPLVPYKTVGVFMALIMIVSGLATLFLLPALITLKPSVIFHNREKSFLCYCSDFFFLACAVALTVVYVLMNYTRLSSGYVVLLGLLTLAVGMVVCRIIKNSDLVCGIKKKGDTNASET